MPVEGLKLVTVPSRRLGDERIGQRRGLGRIGVAAGPVERDRRAPGPAVAVTVVGLANGLKLIAGSVGPAYAPTVTVNDWVDVGAVGRVGGRHRDRRGLAGLRLGGVEQQRPAGSSVFDSVTDVKIGELTGQRVLVPGWDWS